MGDSINMAARLMCSPKAKGVILCDEKTYSLCENEFAFENLGLLKVKGKAHPINIYQPKEAKELVLNATAAETDIFLGREKERALISRLLDTHLTVTGPRIAIIEAESGMGLSTMARWTEKESDTLSLCLLSGRHSSQTEKNTRFFIWQDVIRDLIKAIEAMPENQSRSKNATESRTPLFLMPLKEEGSVNISKSDGSNNGTSMRAAGGNKSILNSGGKGKKKIGRGESSMDGRSGDRKQNSTLQGTGSILAKKKVAISRNRQMMGGSANDDAPPLFHSASQDFGSKYNTAQNSQALKKWVAFEEQLKKALTKAGESPLQVAILNLVYPFDFQQSEVYSKLQGKFRINELTDLLRRLINEIAEWKPVVITIHDSQWIDQLSWEMLWELSMSCPKLMVCLFSRYRTSLLTLL